MSAWEDSSFWILYQKGYKQTAKADEKGRQKRRRKRLDLEPRNNGRDKPEQKGVQHKNEKSERQNGNGKCQQDQKRADKDIQEAKDDRNNDRRSVPFDRNTPDHVGDRKDDKGIQKKPEKNEQHTNPAPSQYSPARYCMKFQ